MPCIKKCLWPVFLIFFLFGAIEPARAVKLKIATLSPEGSMWMEKMKEGAKEVAKKTDNRVTFKFYPGGVMGNDKAVLRKIRVGQLHGGAVVGGSLSRFFPANQLYAQPLKFATIEEVDHVREQMDAYIIDGLEQNGFIVFGLIGGGFAYIMSQTPIETVDDLKRQKVWIPDNDKISQGSIRAFGISPIPLPISDVRTSLQSGLINTVATSPVGAVVLQWHTQIKYVTNLPLIYLHAVLTINKKQFLKIAEKDRQIVREVMGRVSRQIDQKNRQDNVNAVQALKNRGITFITPSKEAMKGWRETGRVASDKMVESGVLPQKKVDEMDALLNSFHSAPKIKNDQ